MSATALGSLAFTLAALAAAPDRPTVSATTTTTFACDVQALAPKERERHGRLGRLLGQAATGRRELANGYELTLDLSKLPQDVAGAPFCVAEVAEWVDLESRCCPFLDFGIDVHGRDKVVRLRLTGAPGVKEFLAEEIPMLAKLRFARSSAPSAPSRDARGGRR